MYETSQNQVQPPNIRAPLLWILAPLILGYQAGQHLHLPSITCVSGGVFFALASLWCAFWQSRHWWSGSWMVCFCSAVFLFAWGWHQQKDPVFENRALLQLPPRAVEFTIQVKRIFQQEDKYQRVSGIGRVRDAPDVQSYLIGTDLYFRASPGETKGPFIRKDLLKLNGIVQPVGWQDQGNQNEFQDYLLRTYVFHESQRSIVISRVEPTHAFPRFAINPTSFSRKP